MTIETKLQQLRIEWKNNPERRKTIEDQVFALKIGQKFPEYTPIEDPFTSMVKKTLK